MTLCQLPSQQQGEPIKPFFYPSMVVILTEMLLMYERSAVPAGVNLRQKRHGGMWWRHDMDKYKPKKE
ncbi:hypothetical protein ANCCAN_12598 [Ancylostoma caninum]|uniref:Uncharacterized protein n=1 Tax=Ancylostoma caninum TaxID=29170 RepID=A0A368GE07_ANCCA|nr:hypothetical protein ANCCAN_12598 [Ancylostoma caninum]